MRNKKHLFIFYPGARGDFLASILIGDILKSNTTGAKITFVGHAQGMYHKMHNRDMMVYDNPNYFKAESFDQYDVIIRIKFESENDCRAALKLAMIKMTDRNFISYAPAYMRYESSFAPLDHQFTKVIPFMDLFDIEKLKPLFAEYWGRDMTAEEQQRITDNIESNLDYLRDK